MDLYLPPLPATSTCHVQMDVTLAEGAEGRWREAAALAERSVRYVATQGVSVQTVEDVQTITAAAWKYYSRPPTALELAGE